MHWLRRLFCHFFHFLLLLTSIYLYFTLQTIWWSGVFFIIWRFLYNLSIAAVLHLSPSLQPTEYMCNTCILYLKCKKPLTLQSSCEIFHCRRWHCGCLGVLVVGTWRTRFPRATLTPHPHLRFKPIPKISPLKVPKFNLLTLTQKPAVLCVSVCFGHW